MILPTRLSLVLAFAAALLGGSARAATISVEDFLGKAHGCVGTWAAESFDACTTPDRAGYADAQMMARFALRGRRAGEVQLSSGAGSLLPSFFSLMTSGKGRIGAWTFDSAGCDDCFVVTSFVVRSRGVSRWYYGDPEIGMQSGTWRTPGLRAIRRIAFYGHFREPAAPPSPLLPAVVPVPASAVLLLGGLAALAGLRRRRA